MNNEQGNGNSYFIHVKTLISFSEGDLSTIPQSFKILGHHKLSPKLRNTLKPISIRNDTVLR